MKRKKIIALLAAGVMASMSLLACGGETTNQQENVDLVANERIEASNPDALPQVAKNRTDTLIVGTTAPKGEFAPIYTSTTYDSNVCSLVFDSLIDNDENGNPIPWLATWKVSEDEKTYTFTLKDGIKFTDGTALTTKDVAFTYTTICDPAYDGPRMDAVMGLVGYEEYNKGDATSVSGIKIIDEKTIEFTLKEVDAQAIWNFGYGIMPEHYYKFDKGNFQVVKDKLLQPMGSGPYKLVHFKPGQEVKFEKNDNYWGGAPKIPYVVMKVTNPQTSIQELISGSVDIDSAAARPENIQPLTEAGHVNLDFYLDNGYGYIGLNMNSEKLNDVKVRQALIYALDRQGFMDSYYQGYGSVYNSHILPISWAYNSDVPKYEVDIDKANKLLDEAGWVDTNGNGIRDKDGVELELKWLTYTDSKYVDTLIPIVQDSFGKIGVSAKPELMEFGTMTTKVDERAYDIYNMAWSLSIDPDPSGIFAIEQDVPGGFNMVGWRNEKADELLKKAKATTSQEERAKYYKEWQLLFSEDLPYIIIGNAKAMVASSSRIKNFKPSTYVGWTKNIHKLEFVD